MRQLAYQQDEKRAMRLLLPALSDIDGPLVSGFVQTIRTQKVVRTLERVRFRSVS